MVHMLEMEQQILAVAVVVELSLIMLATAVPVL